MVLGGAASSVEVGSRLVERSIDASDSSTLGPASGDAHAIVTTQPAQTNCFIGASYFNARDVNMGELTRVNLDSACVSNLASVTPPTLLYRDLRPLPDTAHRLRFEATPRCWFRESRKLQPRSTRLRDLWPCPAHGS